MPGQVRIDCRTVVTADKPFIVGVRVSGATPSSHVEIQLWQADGLEPLYRSTRRAEIDPAGDGVAVFPDVCLAGPCSRAVLRARDEAGDSLDEVGVQVLA